MESTPTLGKLAEALAKAQGAMANATKDSFNPHFKSKYADLASVIEAVRDPLSQNGLSYIQIGRIIDNKHYLVTRLMHSSGEWIEGVTPLILPNSKNDMQALGAAMTYARRYGLSAMVGLTQEDDDGNSVSLKPVEKPIEKPGPQPKPVVVPKPVTPPPPPPQLPPAAKTEELRKKLKEAATKNQIPPQEVSLHIKNTFGRDSSKFLNEEELRRVISWAESWNTPPPPPLLPPPDESYEWEQEEIEL